MNGLQAANCAPTLDPNRRSSAIWAPSTIFSGGFFFLPEHNYLLIFIRGVVPQEVFIPRIRARVSRVQPPAPAEATAAEALSVETSVKADLTEKLPEAEANAENNGDSPLYPWGAMFNPDYEEEEMAPERSAVVIESSGHHTSDTVSISSPLKLVLSSPRDGDETA